MRLSYLDNLIPNLIIKDAQDYIINLWNCSYAEIVSHNKKEIIDFIEENNYEITKIEIERNYYGLDDYRLIVKKR